MTPREPSTLQPVHIVDGEVVTGDGQQPQEHQEKTMTGQLESRATRDATIAGVLKTAQAIIDDAQQAWERQGAFDLHRPSGNPTPALAALIALVPLTRRLLRDGVRLDWMDEYVDTMSLDAEIAGERSRDAGGTFRDSIDAAMAAAGSVVLAVDKARSAAFAVDPSSVSPDTASVCRVPSMGETAP